MQPAIGFLRAAFFFPPFFLVPFFFAPPFFFFAIWPPRLVVRKSAAHTRTIPCINAREQRPQTAERPARRLVFADGNSQREVAAAVVQHQTARRQRRQAPGQRRIELARFGDAVARQVRGSILTGQDRDRRGRARPRVEEEKAI